MFNNWKNSYVEREKFRVPNIVQKFRSSLKKNGVISQFSGIRWWDTLRAGIRNFLRYEIFWDTKFSEIRNFLGYEIFWDTKFFGIRNFLGYEIFWDTKFSGIRNYLGYEIFWDTKFSGIRNFLGYEIFQLWGSVSDCVANRSSITGDEADSLDSLHLPSDVQGELTLALTFNYKLNELYIHIGKVFDVDVADKRRKMDFYIKVYLLPDR